jgi:cytidine deaminase
VIAKHHRPHWHTVAAALRDEHGRIWTGLHLGATVGRLSVCAEPVALGRALLEGGGRIVTAVAVRHPKAEEASQEIAVVSPCGACRELLADYAPGAWVIVPGRRKLPAGALLVMPYQR